MNCLRPAVECMVRRLTHTAVRRVGWDDSKPESDESAAVHPKELSEDTRDSFYSIKMWLKACSFIEEAWPRCAGLGVTLPHCDSAQLSALRPRLS